MIFPKIATLDRLSRYVLGKWITYFIIAFIALFSLAVLGDIVNNVLRNKLTYLQILEQLILNSSMVMGKAFPVSCVLASLFLLNNLKLHSELVALLASGYSMLRLSMVCLLAGILVACFQLINLGFWGPSLVGRSQAFKMNSEQDNAAVISNNKIWIKHRNYFGSYHFFDHSTGTIIQPNFFFYNDNFKPVRFISASKAIFRGENHWDFIQALTVSNLDKSQFPTVERTEVLPLPLYETPETLSGFMADLRSLNIVYLYSFLNHVSNAGINLIPYYLELYSHLSQSLLCVILTLFPFAFPMGLSSREQSSGRSLIFGLIMSAFFLAASLISVSLLQWMHFPPSLSTLTFPVLVIAFLGWRLWPKVSL